jgi:hypothetical protein
MEKLTMLAIFICFAFSMPLAAFPDAPLFEETVVDLKQDEKRCKEVLQPVINAIKSAYSINDLVGECVEYQSNTGTYGIHILGMVPVPKFLTQYRDGQTSVKYNVKTSIETNVNIYRRIGNKLVAKPYSLKEELFEERTKLVNFRFYDECEDYRKDVASSLEAGVVSFCIKGTGQTPGAYMRLTPANVTSLD